MNVELLYLLKVNIGIVLLYSLYKVCFARDTFFTLKRICLLGLLLLSFLAPFIRLPLWDGPVRHISQVILPAMTVQNGIVKEEWDWNFILWWGYWGGVICLLFRLLLQLVSILYKRFHCTSVVLEGQKVWVISSGSEAFSFFRWIFVGTDMLDYQTYKDVLIHEQTHVRQGHSLDILLSEVGSIVCWFNPFAWLLRQELRENLEYIADSQVLEAGYDIKSYQYHLLENTLRGIDSQLYTNFNVLSLKKRIRMMNRKETSRLKTLEYSLCLPLILTLLLMGNVRTITAVVQDLEVPILSSMTIYSPVKEVIKVSPGMNGKTLSPRKRLLTKSEKKQVEENILAPVLVIGYGLQTGSRDSSKKNEESLREKSHFSVRKPELSSYIARNIRYPVAAQKNGESGTVIARFTIAKNGKIGNIKIMHSVSAAIDAEAIRLLTSLPQEESGEEDVEYTLPIQFRLISSSLG